MDKQCEKCNTTFTTNIPNKKYCCEECRRLANNKRRRIVEFKCMYCGTTENLRKDKRCIYRVCLSCYDKYLIPKMKDQREKAILEKYGVSNVANIPGVSEQRKKTSMERYGFDNPMKNNNIKDKVKASWKNKTDDDINVIVSERERTKLKRYGISTYNNRTKTKETIINMYGVENISQLEDIKNKKVQTTLNNFGVDYPQQSDEVRRKTKESFFINYGVYHALQLKGFKEKMRETLHSKYGKYLSVIPRYSSESQELFDALAVILKKYKYTLYYATNGDMGKCNEFVVSVIDTSIGLNTHRFLDFYVKELNKAIEFDEEYHLSDKQQYKDNIRTSEIKKALQNIEIFRVSKKKYLNNKDNVIKKCMDFLMDD